MAERRPYIMLTVLRVGETPWEEQGRLRGAADLPLSEGGRASVVADAARLRGLRIATIYHPADEAATETARLFAEVVRAKRREVPELADPSLGLLEGLLVQDLGERYPKRHKQWEEDPLSLIPPEGEPFGDARARLFTAIARILRKSRAEEVAVAVHPIGFGLLRCWLADRSTSQLWRMVDDGPRLARYALPIATIEQLRETARAETVES